MKHLNISDDAMKIILENAAWADFGLKVPAKQEAKIDESAKEVVEEAAEEHVCPLCQSHLQEAISDEALMEHTANVLEAVNAATLNEEEEEEDGEEDEDEDEDEDSDDEDEQVEEGKMPPQLRKALKGKKPADKMPKK